MATAEAVASRIASQPQVPTLPLTALPDATRPQFRSRFAPIRNLARGRARILGHANPDYSGPKYSWFSPCLRRVTSRRVAWPLHRTPCRACRRGRPLRSHSRTPLPEAVGFSCPRSRAARRSPHRHAFRRSFGRCRGSSIPGHRPSVTSRENAAETNENGYGDLTPHGLLVGLVLLLVISRGSRLVKLSTTLSLVESSWEGTTLRN